MATEAPLEKSTMEWAEAKRTLPALGAAAADDSVSRASLRPMENGPRVGHGSGGDSRLRASSTKRYGFFSNSSFDVLLSGSSIRMNGCPATPVLIMSLTLDWSSDREKLGDPSAFKPQLVLMTWFAS